MDDLQALVERNASGREAEARRAETVLARRAGPLRALARARRTSCRPWPRCASEPTRSSIACWPRTSRAGSRSAEADRERMQAMARAIASRLLHEPTLRLKRSSGEDDAYVYVNALRELFGLDARSAPLRRPGRARCARCARRAGASARRVERPAEAGNAGKPARARAGAARRRGAGRGRDRHRQVERRRARRQGALRARGGAGGARAARSDLAVHSAKDLPGDRPDELRLVGVLGREDPVDAYVGEASSLDEVPQGARVGTASLRRRSQLLALRPDLERGRAARQRRHPAAQAVRGRVRRDRARRRGPAPARAARARSPSASGSRS